MTTSYTFLPWTRRGQAWASRATVRTDPPADSSNVEPTTAAALEGT